MRIMAQRAGGEFLRVALAEEDRPRVLAKLRACRTAALPFTSEYRFLRRDGRIVWLREEATVVRDNRGQPLCLQGVIQDITDRKVAEQRLAGRTYSLVPHAVFLLLTF